MNPTIGDRIIAEIGKQSMIEIHDANGPLDRPLIFVWRANSADQLDALVAEHVAKLCEPPIS